MEDKGFVINSSGVYKKKKKTLEQICTKGTGVVNKRTVKLIKLLKEKLYSNDKKEDDSDGEDATLLSSFQNLTLDEVDDSTLTLEHYSREFDLSKWEKEFDDGLVAAGLKKKSPLKKITIIKPQGKPVISKDTSVGKASDKGSDKEDEKDAKTDASTQGISRSGIRGAKKPATGTPANTSGTPATSQKSTGTVTAKKRKPVVVSGRSSGIILPSGQVIPAPANIGNSASTGMPTSTKAATKVTNNNTQVPDDITILELIDRLKSHNITLGNTNEGRQILNIIKKIDQNIKELKDILEIVG